MNSFNGPSTSSGIFSLPEKKKISGNSRNLVIENNSRSHDQHIREICRKSHYNQIYVRKRVKNDTKERR